MFSQNACSNTCIIILVQWKKNLYNNGLTSLFSNWSFFFTFSCIPSIHDCMFPSLVCKIVNHSGSGEFWLVHASFLIMMWQVSLCTQTTMHIFNCPWEHLWSSLVRLCNIKNNHGKGIFRFTWFVDGKKLLYIRHTSLVDKKTLFKRNSCVFVLFF